MAIRRFCWLFVALVAFAVGSTRLSAQTQTTGALVGTVTDASGAIVPGATVTLQDLAKGTTQSTSTSSTGAYRFELLPPGSYAISAKAVGFQVLSQKTTVALGQVTTVDLQLTVGVQTQEVTVTAAAVPLIQTENGNVAHTLSELQVQNVPNPGNDMSYIAQTAPGMVMNTQAGYGNFSANGLPGNSNLFTINGMDDNDPYLNLNNSGATNLLLGQNEVQEASVVSNGYSGQFGGLAGANISYVTRSGSNEYHGRAIYYWNGRAMNATSYLTKAEGAPKPFSNANQWGGDIGGPLKKDKLFWYFNTEGLRVILPTSQEVLIPTPDFEVSTLNNLTSAGLTESIPFYCQTITITSPNQGSFTCPSSPGPVSIPGNPAVTNVGAGMFNIFNSAPGASRAQAVAFDPNFDLYFDDNGDSYFTGPGCSNYPGLGVATTEAAAALLPACAVSFRSNAPNFTYEYLLATRFDYNWGTNDRVFIRVQTDRGNQATYTDPINSAFSAHSFQPAYQGQLNETHTFGPDMVNQFIMSAAWYSAIFENQDLNKTLATFPTTLIMGDSSLGMPAAGLTLGGENFVFPQGRRVTQFQISDDLSKTIGNHALKFGIKYRRNDVTDTTYQNRRYGLLIPISLDDFAWGGTGADTTVPGTAGGSSNNAAFTILQQRFPSAVEERIKVYSVGGYVEDGWRIRPNLTITGALRIDHFSNPTCKALCFAETAPWNDLVKDAAIPYNQAITTGLRTMLPGFQNFEWQPRVSFAWQPFGTGRNTVIRGGIGIFYDAFQGSNANNFASNPPLSNRFNPLGDNLAPTETCGGGCTNLFIDTAAINTAFVTGFLTGQTLAEIRANAGPFFAPPNLFSSDRFTNAPQYQKWSLEVQQEIGHGNMFSVQYVGNHGIHELIRNAGVNGRQRGSFVDLPVASPDPRFNVVEVGQSSGVSNYNGLTLSFKRNFSSGVVNFNYTWSHAFDESEGLDPFNFNSNISVRFQEIPNNLRRNYGPADWDVRHYVSANYVWELPIRRALGGHGWDPLVSGWTVSGTVFFRTGLPYTATDTSISSSLASRGYGSTVFGNYFGTTIGQAYVNCGGPAAGAPPVDTCLDSSLFSTADTGFGNLGRNSFYGPHFFDSDFTVMKKTKIPGWERGELGIGFQFFNVFNHPNFDQPVADVSSGSFGQTILQVASPTSILGSFLGGDASPRLIQLKAQLIF